MPEYLTHPLVLASWLIVARSRRCSLNDIPRFALLRTVNNHSGAPNIVNFSFQNNLIGSAAEFDGLKGSLQAV